LSWKKEGRSPHVSGGDKDEKCLPECEIKFLDEACVTESNNDGRRRKEEEVGKEQGYAHGPKENVIEMGMRVDVRDVGQAWGAVGGARN
jgi:hypothetical protein